MACRPLTTASSCRRAISHSTRHQPRAHSWAGLVRGFTTVVSRASSPLHSPLVLVTARQSRSTSTGHLGLKMATDYQVTTDQIVQAAMRQCGALDTAASSIPQPQDYTNVLLALNMIIKKWVTD